MVLEIINESTKQLTDTLQTSLIFDQKAFGQVRQRVADVVELIGTEVGGTVSGDREGQTLRGDREEVHMGDTSSDSALKNFMLWVNTVGAYSQKDSLRVPLGQFFQSCQ